MLVRTEKAPQSPRSPMTVRVHTAIGAAVVLWCGDPQEAHGTHLVEWTVDDGIVWGLNTRPAASAGSGLGQEGNRVVMRGQLRLDEAGACLRMDSSNILLDVASPIPDGVDGSWVEIRIRTDRVALYPYQV